MKVLKPKIRTLIVDDEALARKKIRVLLEREPDIDIIGECATGSAAVVAVRQTSPDLMFLDVQMPGLDGFATLEKIGQERLPKIIFVTAYDKYAVRAFEFQAVDYLLKPFDAERMSQVLARFRHQMVLNHNDVSQHVLSLLEHFRSAPTQKRILVKHAGNIILVRHEEIDWVEAADNYVRLHVGGKSYLLRESVTNLESILDQRYFARIHRSTIVNIERIEELQPLFHGDLLVILENGVRLTLSRTYRSRLEERLGQQL